MTYFNTKTAAAAAIVNTSPNAASDLIAPSPRTETRLEGWTIEWVKMKTCYVALAASDEVDCLVGVSMITQTLWQENVVGTEANVSLCYACIYSLCFKMFYIIVDN